MCASTSGLRLELAQSRQFHGAGLPVLISPALLRARRLGQLDLVRMRRDDSWVIDIAEVKSSATGEEHLARGQRKRIVSAGNFLSGIFGVAWNYILLVGNK